MRAAPLLVDCCRALSDFCGGDDKNAAGHEALAAAGMYDNVVTRKTALPTHADAIDTPI